MRQIPYLQTHLINGVVMDIVAPKGLVVSEVMWGEDASLTDPSQNEGINPVHTVDETSDGDALKRLASGMCSGCGVCAAGHACEGGLSIRCGDFERFNI